MKSCRATGLALLLSLLGLSACAARATTIASSDDLPQDQWSRGVWLYGQHCAGCHGEDGAGDEDTPAIAGKGALPRTPADGSMREVQLATAADLFAYVKDTMPPMDPDSLSDDAYWAITVYVLKQAKIDVAEEPLGEGNAGSVALR